MQGEKIVEINRLLFIEAENPVKLFRTRHPAGSGFQFPMTQVGHGLGFFQPRLTQP
jgi:hypothetical protein